jgi:hypothetical protein
MVSVKGIVQDGVIKPVEPFTGRNGQQVIITLLEEDKDTSPAAGKDDWDTLMKLIEDCRMDTGIPDLAHQHDHYLYGKPKKE